MTYGYAEDDCGDEYPDRPVRSKRRLNKMHIWVHRRFHNALEQQLASGKYARYWLDVRSRIEENLASVLRENGEGKDKMNVDKAIEIKSRKGQELLNTSPAEIYEADRLSFEALRQEQRNRLSFPKVPIRLLPGETKDSKGVLE